MSTFVNTVASVGDEALTNSIIDRSITEIADNISTGINVDAFRACAALKTVNFPNVTGIGTGAFYGCTALEKADFTALTRIRNTAFSRCSAMIALILRGAVVCTLDDSTSTFASSSIKNGGTGYVYVPSALVDSYKAASGWSDVADQIRAIEDYPEICDPYTWEAVFKAIDAGTYADTYKVGDLVPLDLGDEGIVNMQIAGIDVDDKADGSGKAPITWISKELLATKHRWNPALAKNYTYETVDAWAETSTNTWKTQCDYYNAAACEATWAITASEDCTLSVTYKTSISSKVYNQMTVIINGETCLDNTTAASAVTKQVSVAAGDTVTVYASYKQGYVDNKFGTVSFAGTGAFTVEADVGTTQKGTFIGYEEGTGSIGGWEKCEMRSYLQETIKPLIPETVRGRLVTVSKSQDAYDTAGAKFTQTTAEEVCVPGKTEVDGTGYGIFSNNKSRMKTRSGGTSCTAWYLRDVVSLSIVYGVNDIGGVGGSLSSQDATNFPICFCTGTVRDATANQPV